MRIIEDKTYYKMSKLVELSNLNNHTISFYDKKGLLPNTVSTSKNMKYYPEITITVLNLIKYFKDNLNFSIDYIKELFDYYQINFENRSDLILQSIQMLSNEIKNPILKKDLLNKNIDEAIKLDLLDDKEVYFKTEIEVLDTFNELKKYDVSTELISQYVKTSKNLALLEKELTNKVLEKNGFLPEVLVLDILNKFKPYVFNRHTILEFKKES
ncbi:MerR family transcriptional regulator [Aliarcobacter butzleri]|uniref:MerR family transcriptional regulator n=1 Tax=Aliarcobacter butzleri TaxID=28197 RepID=A0AAP4UY17_9BACT|nr:MerR family transcriptional regulator [Aliarcobacter butzleri]MCG3705536.1 MerR family transcriptional regulator [Aliarcobacter butzleri]MCT7556345.1 MerR family transcriptional regulator [Aliarcobacter butzleri]MCT7613226.1 MerR family transcriptional regulator [Aliarcobacter butzleri]MCT7640766.1 MerR family transcriptional regulator [Aliarcobacter butzleri]MDK2046820.1 MerR family transcriptional regulator [Aliarcobacter butzleri]